MRLAERVIDLVEAGFFALANWRGLGLEISAVYREEYLRVSEMLLFEAGVVKVHKLLQIKSGEVVIKFDSLNAPHGSRFSCKMLPAAIDTRGV